MDDAPQDEVWQFFPNDSISSSLLATVPRKVVRWLRELEGRYDVKLLVDDVEGSLSFEGRDIKLCIGPEVSTLVYDDGHEQVQLWWDGHWDDPQNLRVSDLVLVEASNNLNDFIEFEYKFYDPLTFLQEELEQKAPTPKMPKYDFGNQNEE